jgi:hypothetical protein
VRVRVRVSIGSEDTKPFVLEEGGVAAVVSAMQAHREHIGIQLSSHEALTLLMDEGKKDDLKSKLAGSGASIGSRLTSKVSSSGSSSSSGIKKKNAPDTIKKVGGHQPQKDGKLFSA